MMLYNYIAGSSFPPSDKTFSEWWRFENFCPSVVIFALGEVRELVCHGLAYELLKPDFQGLIYSIRPENRDFGKCSRFFGVSDYPSYVIVPFPVFLPLGLYGDDGDDQEPFLYRCQERLWRILRNCNHLYSDGRQLYESLQLERHYLHDPEYFLHELQFKHSKDSFYKTVGTTELGKTSSDAEKAGKIIELSRDFCRLIERNLDVLIEMMVRGPRGPRGPKKIAGYVRINAIAGSSFPPSLPVGFSEQRFHHLRVVIFALKSAENIMDKLAINLLENPRFQGLVYSLRHENSDFLKCAEFFGVSTYPSYAIVSYQAFRKFLCLDCDSPKFDEHEELGYAVISPEQLQECSSDDQATEILKIAQRVCDEEMPASLKIPDLTILRESTSSLKPYTEIIVLFPDARNNCIGLEAILYNAFIKFGSGTDDVMVRILHPTFISDEYQRLLSEYKIVQLPCAIFIQKTTEKVVATMERKLFEDKYHSIIRELVDSQKERDPLIVTEFVHLIRDLHRVITLNRITEFEDLVKPRQSSNGEQFSSIQNLFFVGRVNDIVCGDSVGGSKSG